MPESLPPELQSEGERRFRDLFDNAPVGYHEIDADGRYVRVNRTEAAMLGYEPDEMLGRFAWDFVVEGVSKAAFSAKIAGTLPLATFERTFRRKDGSEVPVMLEERLLRDADGTPRGIRTTVFDISERKRAERALRESEERYRRLVELSPDGILLHVDDRITFVNGAAVRLLGAERAEDLLGRELMRFVHPDSQQPERDRLRGVGGHSGPRFHERRFLRLDGSTVDVEVATIPLEAIGTVSAQLVMRDITERKLVERQIRNLAYHDALTGLPNRVLLQDRADVAIAQTKRTGLCVAIAFIDLDGFKEVNDSLGHAAGDALLVAVADRLARGIRKGDTLARLGGDEFVLVLSGLTGDQDVRAGSHNVLQQLCGDVSVLGHTRRVTASMGVAVFPKDGSDFSTLLQRADAAMYRAKEDGKNRFALCGD